jgi:hypothetical protein
MTKMKNVHAIEYDSKKIIAQINVLIEIARSNVITQIVYVKIIVETDILENKLMLM